MADDQQAYLRRLEEEYERPLRVRRFLPRRKANLGGGLTVTVARAAGQSSPVNAGPINFTVTFSKTVTGFANADISFAGSTVGGTLAAAVTGTGPVYNVAVTGMTGNGLVAASVVPGAASDAAGSLTPGSATAFVTLDTTAPSVTINVAAGQADPTGGSLINFTVVFSEPVTGFISSDISFTGSTAGGTLVAALMGSGANYNVSVSGMTTTGNVVASIPAGAATDLAGNTSLASTSTDNSVMFNGTTADFPDASTTGVPVGTTLTPFSGNFLTTSIGQTVDALDVSGWIIVHHANVTVKRCRAFKIRIGEDDTNIAAANCVVQDCTFVGTGTSGITAVDILAGGGGNVNGAQVRRCNISGTENGFDISDCANITIEDNYLHNYATFGVDPHVDGLQSPGVGPNVMIRHNNIDYPLASSCTTWANSTGVTIDNNKLHGGSNIIYIEAGCSGFVVSNNMLIKDLGWGVLAGASIATQTYINNYDENHNPISLPGGGGTTAAIAFQGTATSAANQNSYTLNFAAASAAGQERLFAVGSIQDQAGTATITSLTIDGQTATQVGPYVRQPADSNVVSFWRAPGTSSTSVDVVFTLSNQSFGISGALWSLNNAGTLLASASSVVANPSLDLNTVTGGVVAAAVYAFSANTLVAAWTGLTERFDGVVLFGSTDFTGADLEVSSGSTPLTVLCSLSQASGTPASHAGIAVSFNHV